ncbi:transglycosylase SLT domain-containing protein [Saccharopolyspora cebuensis]|uniref:Transglycosylase SLT domain-containing protein n=1 Tax=Saccharopolyspora cebuensis TaxID=418759 RepID=A0ABV4CMB9_9PSEU
MTTLSPEQIAQHAYDAGFRGDALATSVAVALAESGGNTDAHNDQPPDDSYGLWQINMLGDLGTARREQYGLGSDDELLDPAENAAAAFEISGDGKDFGPWTTYADGKHEKYMDEAEKAARAVSSGGGGSGGSGGGSGGGGGGGGGFSVAPDRLTTYTREAERFADNLENVGKKTLNSVRGIAADSFGKVGEETGFSAALGDFGKSLENQVKAVGSNARKLGAATSEAAKTYRETDESAAKELTSLLGRLTK